MCLGRGYFQFALLTLFIAPGLAATAEEEAESLKSIYKVVAGIQITLAVIGILGNLAVIYVVVVLKEYKKATTHLYVLQFSLADLVFLIYFPISVDDKLRDGSILSASPGACAAGVTITQWNYYVSVLLLMVMSIDRYIAVCHSFSMKLNKLRSPLAANIISVSIWLFSLLLCIPLMKDSFISPHDCRCSTWFGHYEKNLQIYNGCMANANVKREEDACRSDWEASRMPTHCPWTDFGSYDYFGIYDVDSDDNLNDNGIAHNTSSTTAPLPLASTTTTVAASTAMIECKYPSDSGWGSYLWTQFIAFYLVPMIFLFITYGFIIKKLMASDGNMAGGTQSQSKKKRVTWMCIALLTCFAVCWLPFHVIHLAKVYGIRVSSDINCTILTEVKNIFGMINSVSNPYIYTIMGGNFKKRLTSASGVVAENLSLGEMGSGRLKSQKYKRAQSSENTGTVFTKIRSRLNTSSMGAPVSSDSVQQPINSSSNQQRKQSILSSDSGKAVYGESKLI